MNSSTHDTRQLGAPVADARPGEVCRCSCPCPGAGPPGTGSGQRAKEQDRT
ncbi:MAG: hypothetical protein IT371_04455 [Deltaproteobacteria bacterium]|nr:hypothetical protein [Deltaproteobacteria bacterium]